MLTKQQKCRPIDNRFIPQVAGIDLAQSLNYIDLDDVGPEFLYDNYTSSLLRYRIGSRLALEHIVSELIIDSDDDLTRVQKLSHFVAKHVQWAGFYFKETGICLPKNRNLCEEDLIKTRFGWCNEQARCLCCLLQIADIPCRLIFAGNAQNDYGHVVTEALLDSGWLMIDQSLDFLFMIEQKPVSAFAVCKDHDTRKYFAGPYKQSMQKELVSLLPLDLLEKDFTMAIASEPITGFEKVGFHNHFVL